MPRASFSRTSNLKLLIDCLSSLGIDANINDRHDVVLNGKKISGSAYKIERDRAYHHGTMLISSDLDSLKSGLVGESDIIGFGVHSVKSPVTRLIDYNKSVTHDSFCNSLICEFRKEYEIYEDVVLVDETFFNSRIDVLNVYNELKSWEWIYGQNPDFEKVKVIERDHGALVLKIQVKKSRVDSLVVEGVVDPSTGYDLMNYSLDIKGREFKGMDEIELEIRDFLNST